MYFSIGLLALFKLLTRANKFQRAGILAIGVTNQHKGKGLAKGIAMTLYGYHEALGLKSSLYFPVNESNMDSRGFAESIGGKGRSIYGKTQPGMILIHCPYSFFQ